MTTFSDLGVPEVLVRALAAQQITSPFPIQVATLPDTLRGADVLAQWRGNASVTASVFEHTWSLRYMLRT